jgi:hypothetical protein
VEQSRVGSVSCERLLVVGLRRGKLLLRHMWFFDYRTVGFGRVCDCGHEVSNAFSGSQRHFMLLLSPILADQVLLPLSTPWNLQLHAISSTQSML